MASTSFNSSCICGRQFKRQGAYTAHQKTCLEAAEHRRSSAAQWRMKRARLDDPEADLPMAVDPPVADEPTPAIPEPIAAPPPDLEPEILNADQRPRRARRLPKKFADMCPVAGAALPPSLFPAPPPVPAPAPVARLPEEQPTPLRRSESPPPPFIDSPTNKFGLFRRYHAAHFPAHDPDSSITFADLLQSAGPEASLYGPYPNESAFRLAEWQWMYPTKSQLGFQALVKLVGHPDFRTADIAITDFKEIDKILAERGWQDSAAGDEAGTPTADWRTTEFKLPIPFHKRMAEPGVEDFVAGTLKHRSIVSVVRDRITNPKVHLHLHFSPYELHWQPQADVPPVRVHGELYTSDAFLEAHDALQASPREPDCDLERVVLGVMFASDATHLTQFGDAKLLPVYMSLGNESKYRRGEPSHQCFEHIAYFDTVRP